MRVLDVPLVYVDKYWKKTFVFVPRKSIKNQWLWGSCFVRRVWRGNFIAEPFLEYGTIFDILEN
jgi:hypothetical protein